MTNEERILERLDRLEQHMAPLASSARAVSELRDELSPRVNEAVQALITQLADVEADFQIEDLLYLIKKAMRNVRNLNFTLDQLKNLIDFALTAEPLMKSTVPQMIYYLDDLEQKGVFRMSTTALDVIKKIADTYSQEEVQQMGDGLVRLAGILKKITTPESLDLLEKAADLPTRVDVAAAEPIGTWGLLRAMSDPKIKEGMGVVMEMTRGLACLKA